MSIIAFIWKYVSFQRWKFLIIFLLSLVWSLDATLWPYILRLIVDAFTLYDTDRSSAWPALKGLLLFGVSLWVFVEICFRSRDFLQARALPQLEADIRMAMFDHIQHHSPKYFNEHFAGTLSNKINDMTTQVTLILQNLTLFLPTIATCILSILFFWQVNALFAMILTIWIGVVA